MKNIYVSLLATLFVLCTQRVNAQMTADSVPPGMFAVNPYVALTVSPCTTYDSTLYDINCDGNLDFAFVLYKGATIIDGGNIGWMRVINDSFEIIKDTGGMVTGYPRPHYFNSGAPLVPAVGSMWGNDSYYWFGDYGCMMCPGPVSQTNVFVAFRKAGQVGWMKVSFMLVDQGSCTTVISLTIHEVLSPCLGSGINDNESGLYISTTPNPFSDATVVSSSTVLQNGTLTLYDCRGEIVSQMTNLTGQSFILKRDQLAAGMYFMTLSEEGDILKTQRVIIAD